ncbi:MAG: hypothetical protein Q4D91_13210 [Lautropia sp.]|nr:hypothetical protein [Lautropia sp.]
MIELDREEVEVLAAFEAGELKSVASRENILRLKDAAHATAKKDRRVNIRLSAVDLHEIQAQALREGMPYQTLMASVLHKYVTGQLKEA